MHVVSYMHYNDMTNNKTKKKQKKILLKQNIYLYVYTRTVI